MSKKRKESDSKSVGPIRKRADLIDELIENQRKSFERGFGSDFMSTAIRKAVVDIADEYECVCESNPTYDVGRLIATMDKLYEAHSILCQAVHDVKSEEEEIVS